MGRPPGAARYLADGAGTPRVSGRAYARRDRTGGRRLFDAAQRVDALAGGDGHGYGAAGLGARARSLRPRHRRLISSRRGAALTSARMAFGTRRVSLRMDRDTLIVHAGYRKRTEPGPFLPGPQFSSTYTSPGEPSDNALTYGRFHNPTWAAWEEALRVLEGGEAITFASGMAAVDAVLGTVLRPGDAVVLASDCYYTVRRLAARWFGQIG